MELRPRQRRADRLAPVLPEAGSGRAVVIGPYLRQRKAAPTIGRPTSPADQGVRSSDARLDEAVGLARAIELTVVHAGIVPLGSVTPATYIGKGKVEEIAGIVKSHEAAVIIVDGALSPVQQRNLEKAWNAKVLDRTGLILEIFGRRARTREGTLQVEHAHLTYQKGRLVRSWTHLERQRGGFGFLGGPGETQIEADRRAIEERIARIERELEGVKRTRNLHRKGRQRVPYPVVALVGYTNAGKSTLFNRLTGGEVLEADMLFATLDPTLRAVKLPQGTSVIVSDTVGFISDLPTLLIAAFRATLEEVIEADVILHVRDISHPDTQAEAHDVERVLGELGIDEKQRRGRIIELWNKIDRLSPDERARVTNMAGRQDEGGPVVLTSALTGEGLTSLAGAMEALLAESRPTFDLTIAPEDGAGLSWLYRHTEVLDRSSAPNGATAVRVRVDPSKAGLVERRFNTQRGGPPGRKSA